jgi:hypothetical protein
MTTITWNISQLDCLPQEDGDTDVVFIVHWSCNGVDGDQVLGWVWANGVDKDATEAAVEGQIEAQKNPPVVSPPLPWAAP